MACGPQRKVEAKSLGARHHVCYSQQGDASGDAASVGGVLG